MSHDGLSFLRIFPGISLDAEKKDCAPGKPKTEDVPIVCFFGFPYTYMILRPGIKDEVDVFCRSIGFSGRLGIWETKVSGASTAKENLEGQSLISGVGLVELSSGSRRSCTLLNSPLKAWASQRLSSITSCRG